MRETLKKAFRNVNNMRLSLLIAFWTWMIALAIIFLLFNIRQFGDGIALDILLKIVGAIFIVSFVLSIILIFLLLIYFMRFMKIGAKRQQKNYNGHYCFKQIDNCIKGAPGFDKQFHLCIHQINVVYESDDVKQIVENQELKELYNRKDFLEKDLASLSYFSRILMIPLGACIGVIIGMFFPRNSYIFETAKEFWDFANAIILAIMIVFLASIIVAVVLVFRFRAINGRAGSYMHEIQKYELSKLDECLDKIYSDIAKDIKSKDAQVKMEIYETQRVAMRLVGQVRKNFFNETFGVEKLELLNGNEISNCQFVKAKVNETELVFVLNKREWEDTEKDENGKISQEDFYKSLISVDYRKLYDILAEHCGKISLEEKYVAK